MPLIRPAIADTLRRWREVIGCGIPALFGLWLIGLGGLVLVPLGVLAIVVALGLGIIASRRVRFAQGGSAPGVVEVVEGQVSYFGPTSGGSIALPDLVELRLLAAAGHRYWQLRTADGQALLIPVEALGAARLFETFAALPGLHTGSLVAALEKPAPSAGAGVVTPMQSVPIWRHPSRAALTRSA